MESLSIETQLQKISKDLNLEFDESNMQDWGIIYADDTRVEEFMDYFINSPLNKTMQYYVLDLIGYSYNEALLSNNSKYFLKDKFLSILNQADQSLNFLWINWREMADDNFL